MLTVAIPALAGTASLNTAGLMDALKKADGSWALAALPDARRLFDVRLVGLDLQPVACRDGVQLIPSIVTSELDVPDLVVVPGLDDELDSSLDLNRPWAPWIRHWHAGGARIASSCTGAFLVGEAGSLAGRLVTTHWMFAAELQRRYPTSEVRADRMIIDTGDVISSGGATAFLNLVIYLVERFGGHERANFAAKVLLVDGHRSSQLRYVAALPGRAHDDLVVHEVQAHIDTHLNEPLRITELATQFGLSSRTLTRRFILATGRGPQTYLSHARVRHAQRLFETTSEPMDDVRRAVGYLDPAAFRRAFKQTTGISPNEYRQAYGPNRHQGTSRIDSR